MQSKYLNDTFPDDRDGVVVDFSVCLVPEVILVTLFNSGHHYNEHKRSNACDRRNWSFYHQLKEHENLITIYQT